jgi:hypothetical protein
MKISSYNTNNCSKLDQITNEELFYLFFGALNITFAFNQSNVKGNQTGNLVLLI